MAKTDKVGKGPGKGGSATLTWRGDELADAVRAEMVRRLELAGAMVQAQVQRNVSTSARTGGPSSPGEYPHADTGRLRNSIFYEVDEAALLVIIGTPLKYGLYLEYGTSGGRVVKAPAGKTLSWVGRDGSRMFAKTVRVGPIAPRSYLRRTAQEMEGKLQALFTKPIPPGKLKVA
jgi:hypothetical protein